MKTMAFTLSVSIPAKPADVFAALTDSKLISTWGGQKGKVSSKVGGTMEMFDGWVKGSVVKFVPARKLAYTWRPSDWPEFDGESLVEYTFAASGKGTKIVLRHSGFPNESEKKNHRSGWKEFVFDPLKSYFAT